MQNYFSIIFLQFWKDHNEISNVLDYSEKTRSNTLPADALTPIATKPSATMVGWLCGINVAMPSMGKNFNYR